MSRLHLKKMHKRLDDANPISDLNDKQDNMND